MTERRGTNFRESRIVQGECQKCGAKDELLFDADYDETLMCAACARVRAAANPRKEHCDKCGAEPAWRDPKTRKNEFFCATCHGRTGAVFVNRWADSVRRESVGLGLREKVECAAKDRGTECRGEVKWRSAHNMTLCNKHAGKQSVGPEWHQ
jgi:hypothetical protein